MIRDLGLAMGPKLLVADPRHHPKSKDTGLEEAKIGN